MAARLMGASVSYEALPWLWSDQGDLKIQIAGLADVRDRTVELALADPERRASCASAGTGSSRWRRSTVPMTTSSPDGS